MVPTALKNSTTESESIVEFWGEYIINRYISIDELQVVIDIFNLQGLYECTRVDMITYLCVYVIVLMTYGNVPVTLYGLVVWSFNTPPPCLIHKSLPVLYLLCQSDNSIRYGITGRLGRL